MKKADVINYNIYGESSSILEIVLDCTESILVQKGHEIFYHDGINEMNLDKDFSVDITKFINNHFYKSTIGFTTGNGGSFIGIDLSKYDNYLILRKTSFFAIANGNDISDNPIEERDDKVIRARGDGIVFLYHKGTILEKFIDEEEEIFVKTNNLLAIDNGSSYQIIEDYVKITGPNTCWIGS